MKFPKEKLGSWEIGSKWIVENCLDFDTYSYKLLHYIIYKTNNFKKTFIEYNKQNFNKSTIAEILKISRPKLRECMKFLEQQGLIKDEERGISLQAENAPPCSKPVKNNVMLLDKSQLACEQEKVNKHLKYYNINPAAVKDYPEENIKYALNVLTNAIRNDPEKKKIAAKYFMGILHNVGKQDIPDEVYEKPIHKTEQPKSYVDTAMQNPQFAEHFKQFNIVSVDEERCWIIFEDGTHYQDGILFSKSEREQNLLNLKSILSNFKTGVDV